jgi:hypothetical protein
MSGRLVAKNITDNVLGILLPNSMIRTRLDWEEAGISPAKSKTTFGLQGESGTEENRANRIWRPVLYLHKRFCQRIATATLEFCLPSFSLPEGRLRAAAITSPAASTLADR